MFHGDFSWHAGVLLHKCNTNAILFYFWPSYTMCGIFEILKWCTKKKKKLYFAWLHAFWSTMCTKFVVPSNVLNHSCWSRWLKFENCYIHSSCTKWLKWHFFNNIRCFCCSELTYRCVLQQILRPLEMFLLVLDCSIEEVIDIVKTELYMDKGDHIFTHVIFVCTVFCVVQYWIGSVNSTPPCFHPSDVIWRI